MQIIRGVSGGFLVSISSAILAILTTAILARQLGPEGFGIYSFCFSVAMLLATPTQAGLPTLVLRETARYQSQKEWPLMRGIHQRSNQLAFILSICISGFAIAITSQLESTKSNLNTYIFSFLIIPLLAMGNIRGAILQGLKHVVLGQLPENLIRPVALITLISMAIIAEIKLTPTNAMFSHVLASLAAVVFGAVILSKKRPSDLKITQKEYDKNRWLRSLLPLSLLAGAQVLNMQIGTIILGAFCDNSQVGIYRSALQVASVVTFGLSIVGNVAAPHITKLYISRETEKLQKIVTNITRVTTLISIPAAIFFTIAGDSVLFLLYGKDYVSGYSTLVILCGGQLLCALFGPTMQIMNMTGQERQTLLGFSISAAVNIFLLLALTPIFGAIGAACASALSAATLNIFLAIQINSRVNIQCGPFILRNNPIKVLNEPEK